MLRPIPFVLALSWVLITVNSSVQAQPVLEVEPDTVVFGNQPGAQNLVHLWNSGNEPLRIDSLRLGASSSGWAIDVVTTDSTYSFVFAFGQREHWTPWPELLLEEADSILLMIVGYDPCLVCKASPLIGDTLYVYTNDVTRNPTVVPVDFTYYVGVDNSELPFPSVLSLYPNPVRSVLNATIDVDRSGVYVVSVYNISGQIVFREAIQMVAGVTTKWSWSVSTIASGPYLLELRGDGPRKIVSFVLIR